MRSFLIIFISICFCGNVISQTSPVDSISAFIHSDIGKFSENVIQDHSVPTPLMVFFQKSLPASQPLYPKNTITFVQEGYTEIHFYTFLATRFTPQKVQNAEIRKQIVFLDFPDLQLSFEIRVYQISSKGKSVEQRIFWKNTTENFYVAYMP